MRADPGNQLVEANRLGQEVVGAGIEALDHAAVRPGPGHQQHGERGGLGAQPERLDHGRPRHPRQMHVHHEHVDRLRQQDLQGLLAGGGLEDLEVPPPQGKHEEPTQILLVVDDQDRPGCLAVHQVTPSDVARRSVERLMASSRSFDVTGFDRNRAPRRTTRSRSSVSAL